MIENLAAFYLLGTQPATIYPYAPGQVTSQGAQLFAMFNLVGSYAASVQAGPGGAVSPPVVVVPPVVPGIPTPPAGSIEPYWGGVGGGPASPKPPSRPSRPKPQRRAYKSPQLREPAPLEPVEAMMGRIMADVQRTAARSTPRPAARVAPANDVPPMPDDEQDIEMLLLGI